mmetsp:Transcript_23828/g.31057  ORF Transcript_23828/g.31057 Transcript_23828/m.31057 type:complete len:145 (-) Transcript_23828:452-886(-)
MNVLCRNEGDSPTTVRVVEELHRGEEFESIGGDCLPCIPDLPGPSNGTAGQRSEVERPLVKLKPRILRGLDGSFTMNESFSSSGLTRSTPLVQESPKQDMSFQLPQQVNTTPVSLRYGPESNDLQDVLHAPFTPRSPIKRARKA